MTPETPASRRRNGAVIVAALGVVAVAVAGFAVGQLAGPDTSDAGQAGPPVVLGTEAVREPEPTLDLDLGPTDPQDVAECLIPRFADDAASVEVLYGVRQRTSDGSAAVLVLRNAEGELRLCDVNGGDSPSQLPVPSAGDGEPVVFLSNGRASWDCDGRWLDGYADTTWLAVSPEVDKVQQRFVVDGEPGDWFSTRAQDGYAHLQTWLDGPFAKNTMIKVEHRVLDGSGEEVGQSALPTGPQRLEGCQGADVQIG